MIFVIDTSELHDQKRLEGNLLRLFLLAKNLTKYRVCIPQVVLEEHRRASHAAMLRSVSTIEKELKILTRYWGKLDTTLPQLDREFEKWGRWIDERLRVAGIEILPYPSAPHVAIAQRDLARRKPFNDSGKGYRDALIWESVLELAANSIEHVVFISSNSSDFSLAGHLHPDLEADLTQRHLEGRVSLAIGLSNALEKHLNDILPATDQALRDALQRGSAEGIDLTSWAMQDLKDVCPRFRVPQVPGIESDSVRLSAVTGVESITVREARRFQSGEVFVEMDLTIKASVFAPTTGVPQSLQDATTGWKLLGTLLASFLGSQSTFQMSVALTYGTDRAVLAADVWDVRMLGLFGDLAG